MSCFLFQAPRNVTVSNKTSTSLQIAWEAIQNDTILGYRIRYGLNGTSYIITNCSCSNHSAIFVCYNITSLWLRNLEVYTKYWIEVIAFTNETFGNKSLIDVFRTDEDGTWTSYSLFFASSFFVSDLDVTTLAHETRMLEAWRGHGSVASAIYNVYSRSMLQSCIACCKKLHVFSTVDCGIW